MKNAIYATAALVAAAAADSVGSAIVINKCSYDVKLSNVPSADGGYTEIDRTLAPSDTYKQKWTSLSNNNGWSIKLSKDGNFQTNVLQYEYTYQNDATIWYDLSEVDGNPWNGDWEITATGSCNPKQQAYRYATDDAYGMQSCSADATITVTLCSGEDSNDGAASSASSSVAAKSTSEAAASATTHDHDVFWATAAPPTTTFQTVVTSAATAANDDEVIVTVTEYATATAWSHKRQAHKHRRHAHGN